MRGNGKSIFTAVFTLTVITVVIVAALGFTDLLTKDTIAQQTAAAVSEACKTVMPAADSFTPVEPKNGAWQDGVLDVYEAKKGDTVCGYVVKTSTNGKASGLEVMTGIDLDGVVVGVEVVANSETAGYVDTVIKGGLLDSLKGIKADAASVDAVSQATKTSNGIKDGVSLALKVFEEVKANG